MGSRMCSFLHCSISHRRVTYVLKHRLGRCQCKHKPTPIPPQHCKELEGKICRTDDDCGKDGSCIPNPG